MAQLGQGFIHPHLVLSAFVYERTRSTLLVGLLAALTAAGIMWPQLYVSGLIEHLPTKKPFYVGATIVRIVTLLAMSATISLVGIHESGWLLVLFFVVFLSSGVRKVAETCLSWTP